MAARQLSLALVLLLTACGAGSAPPSQAAPTKLVVGLSQVIAQFLPAWVAKDAGIYARHGLDVDQRQSTATTVMAALLAGELTLAITGGPEILNATANGADLLMVANLAPVASLKFEVAPSIQTKDDLVGKKVGITRLGSATHSYSRALFSRIGIDPDKDVSYVQLDNATNEAAALMSGQIHAALLSLPENARVEAAGFHRMYDLSELRFPATGQVVVIPRAWLAAHRETAQQLVDSLVEATSLIRRDRAVAQASLKASMKIDDSVTLDSVYDYFAGSILAPVPYAQPEQFVNDVEVIRQATGKLKDFDVAKIIDNSFVKSAVDRGLTSEKG